MPRHPLADLEDRVPPESDQNRAFYEPGLVGPQTFDLVVRGMKDLLKETKEIITQEVEKARYGVGSILLFGSRARRDTRPDSDWDFLVVVD